VDLFDVSLQPSEREAGDGRRRPISSSFPFGERARVSGFSADEIGLRFRGPAFSSGGETGISSWEYGGHWKRRQIPLLLRGPVGGPLVNGSGRFLFRAPNWRRPFSSWRLGEFDLGRVFFFRLSVKVLTET